MTVRLEKDLLLRVIAGKSCVMVDGPVVFVCDTDDEAIVVKNSLEMLPEALGFAKAMASEGLSLPRMLGEALKFVVNASGRYALDDGSSLRESRLVDNELRRAEVAQLEEMAGVTRQCRICGCTEDDACAGPCYWVELDLCSACVRDAA